MKKDCAKFKADITDYARGAHQYVKDMDALFDHLRKCEPCRNKLFGLEQTFMHLKSKGKKKSLDELKEMFRPDATVGTPLWLRKGPPPEPKLTKTESMLKQGIKAYKDGDYPTARILLNIVVKQLPDDAKLTDKDRQTKADAYYHLGLTHEATNNIDGALYVFSRAIELDPDDADAHFYRAGIYNNYNQLKAALRDYSAAIELNPDYTEALRERASLFHSAGQFQLAIADADRLIELEPTNGWHYFLRAMVYETMGEFRAAIADSARALELQPPEHERTPALNAMAHTIRGRSYGLLGELDNAQSDFNALIKLEPQNADAYFYRGVMYAQGAQLMLESGEYQALLAKAVADFRKSLQLKPGDRTTADYLIKAERELAALEIETQVKKAQAELLVRYKKEQIKLKDYDAEISHLKQEIDLLKDNQKLMLEIIRQKPEYHYRIETPMMPTGKPMRDIFQQPPARPVSPKDIKIPDKPK